MSGKFQMQGGKNWILPKEMNANRFIWDSHWLNGLGSYGLWEQKPEFQSLNLAGLELSGLNSGTETPASVNGH
jgi:hypothetical protein